MKYLNLGCGARYHPAWTNIDIAPRGSSVIAHDLSAGIPLPDARSTSRVTLTSSSICGALTRDRSCVSAIASCDLAASCGLVCLSSSRCAIYISKPTMRRSRVTTTPRTSTSDDARECTTRPPRTQWRRHAELARGGPVAKRSVSRSSRTDADRKPNPVWSSFRLDVSSDGVAIKPDSFFMEAIKASEALGG
jgi:hypothetical protein